MGPCKRGEATGGWKISHNEKSHNLYPSPNNIIKMTKWRMRWAGHVTCTEAMRNIYKILVGKPEGTVDLGKVS